MKVTRSMPSQNRIRVALVLSAAAISGYLPARAAERVTLRSGSQFDCVRREADGDHIRLYLVSPVHAGATADAANYVEVPANAVLSVESIPDPPPAPATETTTPRSTAPLTPGEMKQMLTRAGAEHNVDADLLASVVKAESNGNVLAVSRAGAQGLMQLMPATAVTLGVQNTFVPEQNIGGGSAYLDQLLKRYKDNIALALAAYNAGPLAVDRYHGIPPYRETRAYVDRVIREFNRLKLAAANPNLISSAH
jgi:soluble lytic murein transglycosylase-like protein